MPDVSVVMGVFNGADSISETLESVLGQRDCDFEFVVVDDGSTDATPVILDERAARDARLRVFHQANAGLTQALMRGCAEARGDCIARQDCGDVSLPGRLARQRSLLTQDPRTVMVACAVRFVGPGNEPLYESRTGSELHEGLAELDVHDIKGPPHHGATMFKRSAYEHAGGYRRFFAVAQDIDLWMRLHELGRCEGDSQVGYEARLEAGSISARRRDEQFWFAGRAVECARHRRSGGNDAELLCGLPPARRRASGRKHFEHAKFLYFIGSCLRHSDPVAARRYYWRAFREHPLLLKGLIRFVLG
jgi:glycosyltransferase involved in cell wall biosynthesis